MQPLKLVLLHGMQYNSSTMIKVPKPQEKIRAKFIADIEDNVRDVLIVVLKSRGVSLTEMGKIFNLNKSTISRIIKNNQHLLDLFS